MNKEQLRDAYIAPMKESGLEPVPVDRALPATLSRLTYMNNEMREILDAISRKLTSIHFVEGASAPYETKSAERNLDDTSFIEETNYQLDRTSDNLSRLIRIMEILDTII